MREYERGKKDAYKQARDDVDWDNLIEGPPRQEATPEEKEEAREEIQRQIEEHVAEREHGEADVE